MSGPSLSEDGKWVWTGNEWLPVPDPAEFLIYQDPIQPTEPNTDNNVSDSNIRVPDSIQVVIPPALPTIPTNFPPGFGVDLPEDHQIDDESVAENQKDIYTWIGNNAADMFEVLVDSIAATGACCFLIAISIFSYAELTSESSIAVTEQTITDPKNGLRAEITYEFYADRTEISAQGCYAIWCPTDRIVEIQEPIPTLFCGSRTDSVDGYGCSSEIGRGVNFPQFMLFSSVTSFFLFYFGNYKSTLQMKPPEVAVSEVVSLLVGLCIIYIAVRNIFNHVFHISGIIQTVAVFENQGKYVEVLTLPNILPEIIGLVICFIVFNSRE